MKKNIYIGFSLVAATTLILSFQNCGQQTSGLVPVADGKIVVDDFLIMDEDCSSPDSCMVTAVKTKSPPPKDPPPKKDQTYPGVEYDFGPSSKLSITDEDIPKEFFRISESGVQVKCIFVNRRDDIRFEYLCAK